MSFLGLNGVIAISDWRKPLGRSFLPLMILIRSGASGALTRGR